MASPNWQLQAPISAVVFDCDGTLSAIEGINELAKKNGVNMEISSLTHTAMTKTGINPELYQQRLDLVYPTKRQILELGYQYFMYQVPDAGHIIKILQRLGKSVYLVSAGLYPAVKIFGELLEIPLENIYAVNVEFDDDGNFLKFEHTSPLVHNEGKRAIVTQLKATHNHIIHIGDGLNDLVTYDLVTRFIGYGGVSYRENIAARCQYYIDTLSMSPLLPFALTQAEFELLTPEEKVIYQHGMLAIQKRKMVKDLLALEESE